MKKKTALLLLVCILVFAYELSAKSKILFIPLDDRASSWQFPQKLGEIGDSEVVIPPNEFLGHFFDPGNSDAILNWIKTQDLNEFDAAVVSIDMLAYGGLVASRANRVTLDQAIERLAIFKEIRKSAPKLKIYAQNVIMRLALTYDNENSSYYNKFTEWATLGGAHAIDSKDRLLLLEKNIPEKAIHDYRSARVRNFKVNQLVMEFVKEGVIDYLILSQDDATPEGLHVIDRNRLQEDIKKSGLKDKVVIQPGADEVAMLLLTRALNKVHDQETSVKVIYCSLEKSETVMPFEDISLNQTVSRHIISAGAKEVDQEAKADVLFYVFSSRDREGRAVSFAKEIENSIKQGRKVIVADVDPIGNIQGGDETFTTELINRNLFPALSGYASWNTAGNTIGTALPHGLIFTLAEKKLMKSQRITQQILKAQDWFTIHRVMDDFYYHNLFRKSANAYAKQEGASSTILSDNAKEKVEQYTSKLMNKSFDKFTSWYFVNSKRTALANVTCVAKGKLLFNIPWNRTFEATIDFDLTCQDLKR